MDEEFKQLPPSDPTKAVWLGNFVSVVYAMYQQQKTLPDPQSLPPGYTFSHWLNMKDDKFAKEQDTLYGIVAQSHDGRDAVMAIRGIQGSMEWASALKFQMAAWAGVGLIDQDFADLYASLQIVPYQTDRVAALASARSGLFAERVAELLAGKTLTVVGHSLGGAISTLYVAHNAHHPGKMTIPLICTFASPRVGDKTFARDFDAIVDLQSWRVRNEPDVVPTLPYALLGYEHVREEFMYASTACGPFDFACNHNLSTYLNLVEQHHGTT